MSKLYLIGSLRNDRIPILAQKIRKENPHVEVFDDWISAGPEADDEWKKYEQAKGSSYREALAGYAAQHVFAFDRHHLDTSSHCILVLPAGKSGHLEVAYAQYGSPSKPKTAILLDPKEDPRFDVMYNFIPTILESDDEIGGWLNDIGSRGKGSSRKVSGILGNGYYSTDYYDSLSNVGRAWQEVRGIQDTRPVLRGDQPSVRVLSQLERYAGGLEGVSQDHR